MAGGVHRVAGDHVFVERDGLSRRPRTSSQLAALTDDIGVGRAPAPAHVQSARGGREVAVVVIAIQPSARVGGCVVGVDRERLLHRLAGQR